MMNGSGLTGNTLLTVHLVILEYSFLFIHVFVCSIRLNYVLLEDMFERFIYYEFLKKKYFYL